MIGKIKDNRNGRMRYRRTAECRIYHCRHYRHLNP